MAANSGVAVVDSGATACTVNEIHSVCDIQPSMSVFTGFDAQGSKVAGDADGNLHLFAYDAVKPDDQGCAVKLPVTVLKRGNHNLFSVKVLVEDLGWKLVLQPSNVGASGFYKTVGGVQRRLPVIYDSESRLYKMHYGIGDSPEQAEWAARRCESKIIELPGVDRR